MADWWDNILTNVGQGLSNATTNPQLAPALASAYHFYNQADKYGDMGTELAQTANPFGDRSQYVQGLSDLYKDPSSIENSAAYKFRLSQGLNTLGPQQAAKGGGYGNAQASMIKYAQDMASQEYDKEWQRLYEAGGGKFDPANAAKLRLDAAGLEANSKGAALDALFTPFKPGNNTTINNGSGGTGANPNWKPDSSGTIGTGAAGIPQVVSAIYGGGPGALAAINQAMASGLKFIDLGDGTKIDLAAAARSMGGTDSPGNYGMYPTDGSIGNYGPETPIETPTDPYLPIDPGGFTPTDPYDLGVDDLGYDLSFNDFGN